MRRLLMNLLAYLAILGAITVLLAIAFGSPHLPAILAVTGALWLGIIAWGLCVAASDER